MQKKAELEYGQLKEFFSVYVARFMNVDRLPPESHPMACLATLEKRSKALARRGLRQAVNDCVEMLSDFDRETVDKFDAELRSLGIVTFSEVRRQYSKNYAKIVKRGRIKNDDEFYLLQNVLNDSTEKTPEERKLLEELISAYEGA